MFRYERDMIPVLIEHLSCLYGTTYFKAEFGSGNGIADLVFTTEMTTEDLVLDDYGLMDHFVTYLSGERLLSTASQGDLGSRSRPIRLARLLEANNFIRIEGDQIVQLRPYQPHTRNLIAIEAKLHDWKSGLCQARRYQFFAHKSFLALPENVIHRVNLEMLEENDVGLISVALDQIKIVIDPEPASPVDLTAYYFLSEKFALPFKRMEAQLAG
jgi:hypothetical protein